MVGCVETDGTPIVESDAATVSSVSGDSTVKRVGNSTKSSSESLSVSLEVREWTWSTCRQTILPSESVI